MNNSLNKRSLSAKRYLSPGNILTGYVVLLSFLSSGCSINAVRYSDGSLTDYFQQPIPKLQQPLASTVGLKSAIYYTPAGMKGSFHTDLSPNNNFTLPDEVGTQVKALLQLERGYSKETTIAALNAIAKAWANSRTENTPQSLTNISSGDAGSSRFIDRQSQMASEAYRNGDYLTANTHVSAMEGSIAFQRGVATGTAVMNATISGLTAMSIAGAEMQTNDFNRLHSWLLTGSGAIGPAAPKNQHLDVFFFRFLDGEMFSTDSRMRVAVMLVLLDENGIVDSVVEGSDVLNCNNKCSRLMPGPTARVMNKSTDSTEVQKELWSQEGWEYLTGNGFDRVGGLYQYLLLQQGLRKLQTGVQAL